ncbi:MAG: ribonuclease D [Candidatus Sumerlaeia bacterium]|nr:ribonuclease D [Candidatus Sumerlaeia bacterium]
MTPSSSRRKSAPGPDGPAPDFEFIESKRALTGLCTRIAPEGPLAIDTEFVGERTFYPELELLQLRDAAGLTALIDVKAVGDGAALGKLLADESREKIFHSGSQDLPILERWLGKVPWPLFDTQLAAAMVGLGAQLSYASLVSECLGKKVDKGQTASDWSQRPLTAAQLEYAASDVAHLHDLRDHLHGLLERMGRLDWFAEEQRKRAEEATRRNDLPDDELFRQVKEWTKLSGRQLAVLRELTLWRESEAKRQNVPRKKIMPDNGLIALARSGPRTREDIRGSRQIPQGPVHRHIDDILAVIERASQIPREQWPKKPPPEHADVPAGFVELLQSLVRTMAEQELIAPNLLATSSELTALVNNRHRLTDLDLPVLRGWRRELVGARLIALLEGDLALRIVDRRRLEFEAR